MPPHTKLFLFIHFFSYNGLQYDYVLLLDCITTIHNLVVRTKGFTTRLTCDDDDDDLFH
jgi:hypothetical protein